MRQVTEAESYALATEALDAWRKRGFDFIIGTYTMSAIHPDGRTVHNARNCGTAYGLWCMADSCSATAFVKRDDGTLWRF